MIWSKTSKQLIKDLFVSQRKVSQKEGIMNTNLVIGSGVVIFIVILLGILVALLFQIHKIQSRSDNLSTMLRDMSQLVQQSDNNTNVLIERISNLQQNQQLTHQATGKVNADLTNAEKTIMSEVGSIRKESLNSLYQVGKGLSDDINIIRKELTTEVNAVRQGLAVLQANTNANHEIEQKTAESISRLEAIIAGTQSKGSAGENIVELIFAKLPVEWQVRNFNVNGKTVEFGLKFPNNLVLPIDSKWTATDLLEKFIASDIPEEQQKFKAEIEKAVIQKAKEVRKYIDPNFTLTFGVAVVPDAVYEMCTGIYTEIFKIGIVLVSYSMFVPYLLLVFHTVLKSEQNIDLQRLSAYLQSAQNSLKEVQEEINGRFSRALTMLNNSRDDIQAHISTVNSSLTGLQIGTVTNDSKPRLPDSDS